MNTNVLRKSLAVAVILLFIGVAVAPSINLNVVKASNDNDLVEVATQACGIKGFGNTTVKLTREQYQNLEQYLVDFRARLNQTSTREEAVPIFKEAVVELNRYGLLPRGMSVEQAQKLVIGANQNERIIKFAEKFFSRNQGDYYNINNTLCLITGIVDEAFFWSLLTVISFTLFFPLAVIAAMYAIGGNKVPIFIELPFLFLLGSWVYCMFIKPIHPMSIIKFGEGGIPTTTGIVFSLGLSGMKNVVGTFSGTVKGFTGIRIGIMGCFFLGSALRMEIFNPD